jgi:hypothetical protein
VPPEEAPAAVLEVAQAGAALIGSGLYGVDVKETADGPVLIEINDNPNLEESLEDAVSKDRPYEAILDYFLRAIEEGSRQASRNGEPAAAAETETGAGEAAPPPPGGASG